jgi:hypothetical protein
MMRGEKVRLRALEKSDLAKVWEWVNDEKVMWFWGEPRNVQSLVELECWFTKLQKTPGSPNKQFIIETVEGLTIGRIFHENLDAKHRRTEVGM